MRYDFLGGRERYKRSLLTGETRLVWARVQRAPLRFQLEDGLKRLKRWAIRAVIDESIS